MAHKWAGWLHNPCRLGGPQHVRVGETMKSGINQKWPTSGPGGYITLAALGVPNTLAIWLFGGYSRADTKTKQYIFCTFFYIFVYFFYTCVTLHPSRGSLRIWGPQRSWWLLPRGEQRLPPSQKQRQPSNVLVRLRKRALKWLPSSSISHCNTPHALSCKLNICNSSECVIPVPRSFLPFLWIPNNICAGRITLAPHQSKSRVFSLLASVEGTTACLEIPLQPLVTVFPLHPGDGCALTGEIARGAGGMQCIEDDEFLVARFGYRPGSKHWTLGLAAVGTPCLGRGLSVFGWGICGGNRRTKIFRRH